jgi:hypothetical protein
MMISMLSNTSYDLIVSYQAVLIRRCKLVQQLC